MHFSLSTRRKKYNSSFLINFIENDEFICPFFGWTTLADREGSDCFASPKGTCSSSGRNGYTPPKQRRSLVCRKNPFYFRLDSANMHLKQTDYAEIFPTCVKVDDCLPLRQQSDKQDQKHSFANWEMAG